MTKHSAVRSLHADAAPAGDFTPEPRTYEVDESLPVALIQAREAIMPLFRPTLRKHGLTDLQWRVLLAVRSSGEIEVAKLAKVSCLLAPSLSRVLKDLTARSLLRRRAPVSDQRRSLISLSDEGRALMAEVFPGIMAGYDEIERRYGAEKMTELRGMLVELWDVLARKR